MRQEAAGRLDTRDRKDQPQSLTMLGRPPQYAVLGPAPGVTETMRNGSGGPRWGLAWTLALTLFGSATRGQVVISEFLAVNRSGLTDEDGEVADWVELFNTSDAAVNLEGWALSDELDNPRQWIFPAVEIAPRGLLIVFASGKDRRDPAGELHLNFALAAGGEFLGLLTPGGVLASAFLPEYPPQLPDSSFGHPMTTTSATPVDVGAIAHYLVPTSDEFDQIWMQPDFNDSTWLTGPSGIGFDVREEPLYTDLIQTDVSTSVQGVTTTVYVRLPFQAPADPTAGVFRLRLQYDDGFVAWLNGVEILRRNFTAATPRFTSRSRGSQTDVAALTFEDVILGTEAGLIVPGENVLAIQLLNRSGTDEDMLLVPVLEFVRAETVFETERFYDPPTPGWPGGEGFEHVTGSPTLSEPSGAYPEGLIVEVTPPPGGAEVRYTLDGTVPSRLSPVYSGPITIEGVQILTARAFQPDALPSGTVSGSYVLLAPDLLAFDSNLPLLVCTTFGRPVGGNCGGGLYTPGSLMAFAPGDDGRTRFSEEPQLAELAGFRKRGSSSCGRPKFSFNIEVRDEQGEDKDVELLDFGADSDFIMYGPYNFDRALMRNPIAYWMSREVGSWAARTEFVECFYHPGTGPVTLGSYFGVYVLMEKNKRGADRIDVERLEPTDTELPEVSGGYILKRDRIGQGETSTSAGGYTSLVFVYPKAPAPAQRAFITENINQAIASLSPEIGGQEDAPLIDFLQWIDHHILNFYPKNVDAFRLSGYMHKPRNGPFAMGPVWDYDRAMGASDDDRARDPEGWTNTGSGDGGTQYFQAGGLGSWYSHLFGNREPTNDTPWARAYRARWRELRGGPLRSVNIAARIDSWGELLAEAAERNAQRWPAVRPTRGGNFLGEVEHLKNWLLTRADWIDSQFVEAPSFSLPGGIVELGVEVALSVPEGDILLTLNGPDPRGEDGEPIPGAVVYSGPIVISAGTRIRTRTRVEGGVWSQLSTETYVSELPTLAITELLFAPVRLEGENFRPTDYEFIELFNFGDTPLDLAGVSVTQPSRSRTYFAFAEDEEFVLDAGEYTVLVKNLEAFQTRYADPGIRVAGTFLSPLSLSNGGQDLSLSGGLGETVLDFVYDDQWDPRADDAGHSLVIVDPTAGRDTWSEPASWTASVEIGGSPGRADGSAVPASQRPGDINQDAIINLVDGIRLLEVLVGRAELPCASSFSSAQLMDNNGDGVNDLTDALHILNYVFQNGPPPSMGSGCVALPGCADVCVSD